MSLAQAEAHQRKHGFMKGGDANCENLTTTRATVRSACGSQVNQPEVGSNAAPTFKPKARMNKTERDYGLILEARKQKGEIDEYAFEPFSLRYGYKAFYKPDWVTRKGGKVTIAALAELCEYNVIDISGDMNLWRSYQDVARQGFFTIIEVKGGRIYPEAKPRFKAAKERHRWAGFEMHQKKNGTWGRIL